ncbi:hypothetical protein GCK72_001614 [Caenorhabditis remanei]|uniref:Uncharacterized protein n=1 Tax=Caenorhabditis remanei TaxID=31234 RepID=A0A6A5HTZ2_CAERE|nr:hypothetical protein GCK72_001614 [Caenorhabditis remanei]KAF1769797.1 hypothetical protein GCK72_001614 [Caenorhabditis remanei]
MMISIVLAVTVLPAIALFCGGKKGSAEKKESVYEDFVAAASQTACNSCVSSRKCGCSARIVSTQSDAREYFPPITVLSNN